MSARITVSATSPTVARQFGATAATLSEHAPRTRGPARVEADERHFRALITIVGGLAFGLAVLLAFMWIQQRRIDLGVASVGLGALGTGMLVGARRVDRAKVGRAAALVSSGLLVVVASIAVAGNNTPTLAMTALLAVLISVPYVDRPTLLRLSIFAWVVGALVGLLSALALTPEPRLVDMLVRFLGVCLNMSIALFVIFHLSGRLNGAVERYRDLVQRVPVGIYRTTPDGRFLDANPAFARMFGLGAPDDLSSIAAVELYADPADRTRFQEAVESAGVARSIEYRARRPDGHIFWIRDSSQLVRDKLGHPMYYEGIVEDVTEQKRHELRLEQRASVDGLTGLANRAVLVDLLDEAVAGAEPGGRVGLLFVDLDDFKQVNDRFGHAAGDTLLVEAGVRLRNATRAADTVARFGGDEFAVLLEVPTTPKVASAVAKRVVDAFRAPFAVGTESVSLGASVGVAIADEPMSSAELIRRADEAMYDAKSRTKVAFFAA